MKTLPRSVLLFLPLVVVLISHPFQATVLQQEASSATPTYDPLAEPVLPEHPTEYELGRNLYWHWCMTCHGDRGQGLTDEFRGIWEPEHQNCWGRGCHAGRRGDEGFPIPTVVPALVNETQLTRFESVQELSDFLKATHPPQSPGILKNEEYHAIALFVFTMNNRSVMSTPIPDTPAAVFTPTLSSAQEHTANSLPIDAVAILTVLILGLFALAWKIRFFVH